MKRLLATTTALSMIVTSVPLPLQAQQTVRVGNREVICLRSQEEACPEGASCVVARRAANCERNANRKFGGEAEPAVEEAQAGESAPRAAEAAPAIAAEDPPAEPEVVEEAPAEPEVTEVPAEPEVAEEAPAESEVVDEAPVEPEVVEEAPAEPEVTEAPAEPAIAEEAPAEPEVAEDVPAEPAPTEEPLTAPDVAEDAPAGSEAVPAEEEPALRAVEDAPVGSAPEVAAEEPPARPEVAAEEAPAAPEAVAGEDTVLEEDPADPEPAPEVAADEPAPAPEAEEAVVAEPAGEPLTEEQLLGAVDPAEGVEAPPVEAVSAISDILADDAADLAEPPVAAAAEPAVPVEEPAPGERRAAEPAPRETPREAVVEVTEADARASDEEFEGEVIATERARDEGGRDRLSNLEKFGLVALGALVVGSILRNGNEVVSNTGDRVVVRQPDGRYVVLRDDDTLIRQPGSTVRTETYSDGSTRSTVVNADGSRVVTIRDAAGRVLQRTRIDAAGREVRLIDDLAPVERVDVTRLPAPREGAVISTRSGDAALRAALLAEDARAIGRSFSLRQIREYPEVRALAPSIDVDNITFESGSAAIRTTEAQRLAQLGRLMAAMIEENPAEIFLIEGHTDAVGSAAYNLALSDRRAESVALALTEYYGVPPENMVVQGYGETELLIPSAGDEPANRRAEVRIISPLLQRTAAN